MFEAFKALSIGTKLGIAFGFIVLLLSIVGSTAYVSYNKGLNVSKLEIQSYKADVANLNSRLKTAQGKVDVKVITEYKDRINYVDRVTYKTKTVVETIIKDNMVPQFNLSKGWIYVYNQSALGLEVDPVLAADSTPSTVTEMQALADTIVPNNGRYLSVKAQLEALQSWVTNTEKSHEKVINN
jgi:hypothetical protein